MSESPNYSTLLAGAASGLEAVQCIYFDDLTDISAAQAWALAVSIFDRFGVSPGKVSYAQGLEAKRVKPATFERRLASLEVDSIAVAVGIDDPISQIYEAPTYVGLDLRAGQSGLFFYSDKARDLSLGDWATSDLFRSLGYSVAYAFDFALPFSPSAYFWGLGYSPNRRKLGEVTRTDGRRLECWSQNQRRGLRPSQGYLRDVYQQNLLNDLHLSRRVEGMALNKWILENGRGTLQPIANRWLWTLDAAEIHPCRFALNQSGLLLSGRELSEPS